MFYQVEYMIQDNYGKKGYIVIGDRSKAICDKKYFVENGFKDFINLKLTPTASGELLKFSSYQDEFTNFDKVSENIRYVFDENGMFIKSENR